MSIDPILDRKLILNLREKNPIILLEFLTKTQELSISTDANALQALMDKDLIWLLVMSQLLIKAGNQYIQEYITQKKLRDEASNNLIDNLSV